MNDQVVIEGPSEALTAPAWLMSRLDVQAYDCRYDLFVGSVDDVKHVILGRFPHVGNLDDHEELEGYYARSGLEFGVFLVVRNGKVALRTVLHECWHLTRGILTYRDAMYDEDHDEHAALLHEHVTSWTIQTLQSRGLL